MYTETISIFNITTPCQITLSSGIDEQESNKTIFLSRNIILIRDLRALTKSQQRYGHEELRGKK
jgi:hypothetical protein